MLVLAALPAGAAAPDSALPVVVYLADGTSVPLRDWTLSYEYVSWPAGGSQATATTARREARELWLGKRRVGLDGVTLEIEHRLLPNDPGEGGSGPAEIPVAARLRLTQDGEHVQDEKPEPPHRDLLLPGAPKNSSVLARSLDLHGTTLTGTRRELCVLSYTLLVQCGVERGGRVVKVEFPPAR
jgi:hypothetical protein